MSLTKEKTKYTERLRYFLCYQIINLMKPSEGERLNLPLFHSYTCVYTHLINERDLFQIDLLTTVAFCMLRNIIVAHILPCESAKQTKNSDMQS